MNIIFRYFRFEVCKTDIHGSTTCIINIFEMFADNEEDAVMCSDDDHCVTCVCCAFLTHVSSS